MLSVRRAATTGSSSTSGRLYGLHRNRQPQMESEAADLGELPRRPALDAGAEQSADQCANYYSACRGRHGVADLTAHAWVRRTPRLAAAVPEHEVVRKGLQPSALPVGQPARLDVVVAVG